MNDIITYAGEVALSKARHINVGGKKFRAPNSFKRKELGAEQKDANRDFAYRGAGMSPEQYMKQRRKQLADNIRYSRMVAKDPKSVYPYKQAADDVVREARANIRRNVLRKAGCTLSQFLPKKRKKLLAKAEYASHRGIMFRMPTKVKMLGKPISPRQMQSFIRDTEKRLPPRPPERDYHGRVQHAKQATALARKRLAAELRRDRALARGEVKI